MQEFSHYKVKYNTTFPTTFGQHSYYLQLGVEMKVGKVFFHFQSSEVFLQHKTGSFIQLVKMLSKRKLEVVSKIILMMRSMGTQNF